MPGIKQSGQKTMIKMNNRIDNAAVTLCRGGILLINGWILRVQEKSSLEVVFNMFNQYIC